MMVDLKNKKILYIDFGNYIKVAMRLAREDGFGTVYYYCNWQSAYPKYDAYMVGMGIDTVLPNFKQVHSIWDVYHEVDAFVIPDLYSGDFTEWLRLQGKIVFGVGRGEDMELQRDMMKEYLKELKLSVNEYQTVIGLDNLREILKEKNDLYVKTNMFRGSMETFHHDEYKLSKPRLDRFEHTLGIYKDKQKFIVETSIKNSIDFAIDMITADGKFPEKTLMGIEGKNTNYIGVFTDYDKAPANVRKINEKIAPALAQYRYRMALSPECRITKDGTAYLSDMCCRLPEPPTSIYVEMYENFPELVWMTAIGERPVIKSKYKYAAQLVIKAEHSAKEPQAIYFPKEIENMVNIKNLCIHEGVYYYLPQEHDMCEIGGVIGLDNTLDGAIKNVLKNAKLIKGDGIYMDCDSFDSVEEDIKKAKKFGINIF